MNKKFLIIFVGLIILIVVFTVVLKEGFKKTTETTKQTISSEVKNNSDFLLSGFPINKVPLYKQNKISSSKIFVNTDPKNTSTFGEKNFTYYNVVFNSEASQEEFLNYYKGIFDSQITEEYENQEMVKGNIGEYKVSASHYGDDTGYLQVYLPDYKSETIEQYFVSFPKILKENSSMVEHEKSYGLLNQKGGETEYTKYFTVIDSGDQDKDGKDDVDEFLILKTEYEKEYKDKPKYSYEEKTGTMKWQDDDFEATLTLSKNHGRVYLMLRKPLNK